MGKIVVLGLFFHQVTTSAKVKPFLDFIRVMVLFTTFETYLCENKRQIKTGFVA